MLKGRNEEMLAQCSVKVANALINIPVKPLELFFLKLEPHTLSHTFVKVADALINIPVKPLELFFLSWNLILYLILFFQSHTFSHTFCSFVSYFYLEGSGRSGHLS